MTIPNMPPDNEVPDREPGQEVPPDGPTPSDAPVEEPGWQAPGADEGHDPPMRMPSDNPDVETEI